jgi:GT2 family glycosyltransferase
MTCSEFPEVELSVITVTYQSAEVIGGFLEAACATRPDAEVIVVDNASTDDTRTVATAQTRGARVVALEENVGFGRATNRGAAEARGKWLLFANPDVRLQAAVLPNHGANGSVGLAATATTTEGRRARLDTRAETTYAEDVLANLFSRFLPPSISPLVPPPRSWPTGWVSGAMFLTSRQDFLAVGGFDPRYFLYFEDRDLGRRYRAAGFPITFADGVVGHHSFGGSSTGVARPGREAWALLSWLEYLGIWRDQRQADLTAARALRTLSAASTLVSRTRVPERVRRKASEARQIIGHMSAAANDQTFRGRGYYPHAFAAVDHAGCGAGFAR